MPATSTSPATTLPPPKPDLSFTRKPEGVVSQFLWRRRMWVESTFVLSMLEPWEKILLLTIFSILTLLVCSGIVLYLPQHIMDMKARAMYYLWGQEGGERLLWQWLGFGSGLHKEL